MTEADVSPPEPSSGAKAMVLTTGTNYTLISLGIVTSILVAHALGPTGRGQLSAIQLWPLALGGFGSLGLPEAMVFFSAKGGSRPGEVVGTALVLGLLSCTVLAVVGFFLLPWVLHTQSDKVVHASRIYLVITVLFTTSIPVHVLRGRRRFAVWNSLRLLTPLSWLSVLLVGSLRGWSSPFAYAYAMIGATAFCSAVELSASLVLIRDRPRFSRRRVRPLLRFGLPSAFAFLPQLMNVQLDQILLAGFVPARELGLYVTAVGFSKVVSPALGAVAAVTFPRVSAAESKDRGAVLAHAVRMSVLLGGLMAGFFVIITPTVLPVVYGSDFRVAVRPAMILVVATTVAGMNLVLQDSFRGLGRPGVVLGSEIVGLVVTVAGLALLLGPFGIAGAATATLVAYLAIFTTLALSARRVTSHKLLELVLPRLADVRFLLSSLSAVSRFYRAADRP